MANIITKETNNMLIKIELKKAKRCANCIFFDYEYGEDGNCLHANHPGRQTNTGLICKLYTKDKKKR